MSVRQQSVKTDPATAGRKVMFGAVGAVALAIVTMGCGQGDSKQSGPSVAPKTITPSAPSKQPAKENTPTTNQAPAAAVADTAAVGSLTGTVTISGTVPELALLVKQGDPSVKDPQVCGLHNIPDESLRVNRAANNGVAGVFIYLVKAPSGTAPSEAVPSQPVTLDQQGCRYVPHTSVVRVGQPVLFLSSDATAHNVHALPTRNSVFNQTVSANNRKGIELVYQTFELEPVEIKCDIHAWMRAWQLPLDHPFAAVTDENGHFAIENLPAGTHAFRIWHERAHVLDRAYKVEIQPGQTKEISLSFPAAKFSPSGP